MMIRKIASMVEKTLKNGGGSFNSDGSEVSPRGYAVAISQKYSQVVSKVDSDTLLAYYRKHVDLLVKPNHVLGTWIEDETRTWLDISVVVHDLENAIKLAKENNQIAIFDLENMVEIPTGGTGL